MSKVQRLTKLAVLTAVVILFQLLGSFIHIGPTSISLVLIPIVVGAMVLGCKAGAFLGFVFGAVTLWAGISGSDPFTSALFQAQPLATAVICLGKATLAGFSAGLVYQLLKNKNRLLAAILASAAAPVVNTGIFILGGLFLVNGTLVQMTGGEDLIYFLVIACAGINFIAEFIVNIVVSPAISTVVQVISGKK